MFDTATAPLKRWEQREERHPVSDSTPQGTPDVPPPPAPGAYPPPPAYAQQGQQPYAYGQAAPYGASPYTAGPKTNGLAITSLVSSIAAFVVLPFLASIVGVITGHIALKQLRTSGENGRGMALAGVIVGWVGVALGILGILILTVAIIAAVGGAASYESYS